VFSGEEGAKQSLLQKRGDLERFVARAAAEDAGGRLPSPWDTAGTVERRWRQQQNADPSVAVAL
jgi:hypothetical protein